MSNSKILGGKRAGAGRPSGSHSRATIQLHQLVAQSGKNPVNVLLELLDSENPDIRYKSAKELMGYLYPKLRTIELEQTEAQAESGKLDFSRLTLEESQLLENLRLKMLID